MLEDKAPIAVTGVEGDWQDKVLPFSIENQDVRGRLVRLGPALNQILAAHKYPDNVAGTMAETLALTAALGSILKAEDSLSIQAKGDGALSMMLTDYRAGGAMRGYAQLAKDVAQDEGISGPAQFGKGFLALTLEKDGERYQGIVELEGETMADCAVRYFEQSEQTPTRLFLAAERDDQGWWRAGAILLQHLAKGEEGGPRLLSPDQKEDWSRVGLLMETISKDELLSPQLASTDLLFRLFHEEGVRVFPQTDITKDCRCTREHISSVLSRFSDDDITHMVVDGKITVTCEFCSKDFVFDPEAAAAE
jgi:molecular chaperone Hsp33